MTSTAHAARSSVFQELPGSSEYFMSWSGIGSALCKVRKSDTRIVSDGSYRFSKENSLSLHWAPLPSRIYCTPVVKSCVPLPQKHPCTCTQTHTPANTQHVKGESQRKRFSRIKSKQKDLQFCTFFFVANATGWESRAEQTGNGYRIPEAQLWFLF